MGGDVSCKYRRSAWCYYNSDNPITCGLEPCPMKSGKITMLELIQKSPPLIEPVIIGTCIGALQSTEEGKELLEDSEFSDLLRSIVRDMLESTTDQFFAQGII